MPRRVSGVVSAVIEQHGGDARDKLWDHMVLQYVDKLLDNLPVISAV